MGVETQAVWLPSPAYPTHDSGLPGLPHNLVSTSVQWARGPGDVGAETRCDKCSCGVQGLQGHLALPEGKEDQDSCKEEGHLRGAPRQVDFCQLGEAGPGALAGFS